MPDQTRSLYIGSAMAYSIFGELLTAITNINHESHNSTEVIDKSHDVCWT